MNYLKKFYFLNKKLISPCLLIVGLLIYLKILVVIAGENADLEVYLYFKRFLIFYLLLIIICRIINFIIVIKKEKKNDTSN